MTALPPLHAAWLADALDAPLPEERRATCAACAMAPAPDDAPGQLSFDPALKCCTYQPTLPNFAVGRILDDDSASGRAEVARRVDAGGEGVTPAGIAPPDSFSADLADARARFGGHAGLRCPYLDGAGGCGIWRHREAVCATWFCKHEHGARGLDLWRWLRLLMQVVERALASWAAARLGAGDADWGPWAGRARDFYRAAAALAAPLGWDEVRALAGPQVEALAREVRAAQARIAAGGVPDALRAGPYHVLRAGPLVTRVVGYRASDAVDVPNDVLAAVAALDGTGRPPGVDAATLQRLCDQEILVPAAALTRAGRGSGPGRRA